MVDTDTDYENAIGLDGGISSSLYGIEETVGGQNTTLFQQGDQIYDSSLVPLTSTISVAGALGDGIEHVSNTVIKLKDVNSSLFTTGETVTSSVTGLTATVVSYIGTADAFGYRYLTVESIVNNGNTYKFTTSDTIAGGSSGATGVFVSQEYKNLVRIEPE